MQTPLEVGPSKLTAALCYIQFGAGHRSCLGKHIAYLETYKVVPTLLRKYKVSAAFSAPHSLRRTEQKKISPFWD